MSVKKEFRFHFGGCWKKKERWYYEGWDVNIVKDDVNRMTYDRIQIFFSELGLSKPRNIYVRDPDKILEEGLVLIKDDESCRKALHYMDILEYEHIDLFIDDEIMPMPDITPCQLFVENNEMENLEVGRSTGTVGVYDYYMEDAEEINFVEVPTQFSRSNIQDNVYVSPIGYESEEEEEENEENDGELDEEYDNDSETESKGREIDNFNKYSESPQGCFTVGLTFANAQEARDAINEYGVKYGYKLKFEKNEKTRVRVRCMNATNCPFTLLVSIDGDRGGLAVKTSIMEHKCFQQREVPSASQGFIAKYFKDQVYGNPKFKATDMQAEMEKHLKTHVSVAKCKRAKNVIIHELGGSFKQEFANLSAYAHMEKESNPGSKCEIQLSDEALINGKRIFRRIFVCFDACKKNWLAGCRPLIGLDGCFLKGVCPGMLLTAVGKDGNDQVVPIAWAVVNKENKLNWRWFLCWLRQELELKDGAHITIMSDMQKVGFPLIY